MKDIDITEDDVIESIKSLEILGDGGDFGIKKSVLYTYTKLAQNNNIQLLAMDTVIRSLSHDPIDCIAIQIVIALHIGAAIGRAHVERERLEEMVNGKHEQS